MHKIAAEPPEMPPASMMDGNEFWPFASADVRCRAERFEKEEKVSTNAGRKSEDLAPAVTFSGQILGAKGRRPDMQPIG